MAPSSTASRQRQTALSAPNMLQASPQHHEYVMKLRIPVLFSILPRFLQKIICQFSCLSCLAPRWERRFLILLGGYLYKFTNDTDPTKEPKGSPLPIRSVDINLLDPDAQQQHLDDGAGVAWEMVPPPFACRGLFLVSTLRKKHYYATPTVEDAATWVNSLRQGRDEAVKRSMGHAPVDSYPTKWTQYDRWGQSLVDRKDRIRQRMQESNIRELELSSMTEGATAPRGYFG
eukprot:scaffold1588_cov222-Amphora_coffeaeformis.AAC.17